MNAIPKGQKISRYEKAYKNGSDISSIFPEIKGFGYLITWLSELDFCMSGGFGPTPLTFQEIFAWGKLYNISLWEASKIKALSNRYVSKLEQFKDPRSPRPYIKDMTLEEKKALSQKIKSIFRNIKKERNTKNG